MTTDPIWQGPPALRPLLRSLEEVQPHPDNARNSDLGLIVESLDAHGQFAPIAYQTSTGRILKGNHVYAAMLELGWSHGAMTPLDVNDEEALRVLLVDNRASDLSNYDPGLLVANLEALQDSALGLEGTGYGDRDLLAILAQIDKDATRDLDAGGSEQPERAPSAGVVSYSLVFDDEQQQATWYALLKHLRGRWPDATIGTRITRWAMEAAPLEDAR